MIEWFMALSSQSDSDSVDAEATEPKAAALRRADASYVFRGDDAYCGGVLGRERGAEADAADIQDFADHVLRKESNRSSRYVSFTEEVKIARRFTSAADNRFVWKASMNALRDLEQQGVIRIWDPDQVFETLRQAAKKLYRQAGDVRAAMLRNREFLIEGQVPEQVLQRTN
jgi:hypothetical protein